MGSASPCHTPESGQVAAAVVPPAPCGAAGGLALLLSAVASPFLVLPAFAAIITARASPDWRQFLGWFSLAAFFSTGVPLLHIVAGVRRGRITDLHVMHREQRAGPFVTALLSNTAGTALLFFLGAPFPLVVLGVGIVLNGILFALITLRWKISMHPSVYTAAVLSAAFLVEGRFLWMMGLLPAIVWARAHRGRHNLAQGAAAVALAAAVTLAVLCLFGYGDLAGGGTVLAGVRAQGVR